MGSRMMYSVFWGSWDSTSDFIRRSRNGLKTLCKLLITSIFSSVLRAAVSPVLAKGLLNHSSKVCDDLKMSGSKKFIRPHSSGRLFWSGVPVSSSRLGTTRVQGVGLVMADRHHTLSLRMQPKSCLMTHMAEKHQGVVVGRHCATYNYSAARGSESA